MSWFGWMHGWMHLHLHSGSDEAMIPTYFCRCSSGNIVDSENVYSNDIWKPAYIGRYDENLFYETSLWVTVEMVKLAFIMTLSNPLVHIYLSYKQTSTSYIHEGRIPKYATSSFVCMYVCMYVYILQLLRSMRILTCSQSLPFSLVGIRPVLLSHKCSPLKSTF